MLNIIRKKKSLASIYITYCYSCKPLYILGKWKGGKAHQLKKFKTKKPQTNKISTLSFHITHFPLFLSLSGLRCATFFGFLPVWPIFCIWHMNCWITHFSLWSAGLELLGDQFPAHLALMPTQRNAQYTSQEKECSQRGLRGAVVTKTAADWTAPPTRGDPGLQVNGSSTTNSRLPDLWLLQSLSKRKLDLPLLYTNIFQRS